MINEISNLILAKKNYLIEETDSGITLSKNFETIFTQETINALKQTNNEFTIKTSDDLFNVMTLFLNIKETVLSKLNTVATKTS